MRLDVFLLKNGYYTSRNKASEAISRGVVSVNDKIIYKPSFSVKEDCIIQVTEKSNTYVSIGGYKLEKAITAFLPEIAGRTFLDIGASTGGFTDCLLQYGAKKVYCIDVGENLLDKKLAEDERTVIMDNTNARMLTSENFSEKADGIVIDCSFISLKNILPPVYSLLKSEGYILALIKPQFETEGKLKMKNGILKNDRERKSILKSIYDFVVSFGACFKGICLASIDEKKNKEFFAYILPSGSSVPFDDLYDGIIEH